MATKKQKMIVRAVESFTDALTGKTFRPHEVVEGWNEERALHYQDAGLVEVVYASEAEDPQMKLAPASPDAGAALEQPEAAQLEDAPGPETAKEEAGKPGPKETKPKSGGTVKK